MEIKRAVNFPAVNRRIAAMTPSNSIPLQDLAELIKSIEWYHTIDLGNGLVTPGFFDHRPYLPYYKIPDDLTGKTVLDIGAASGFFSFEFEKRGAQVTATDLPDWFDHDFGPVYEADKTNEGGGAYLHEPFELARKALGSKVNRKLINIYDISPDTVGLFDMVFCGSVLLHLTDPIKALWNISSVTKDKAIIATVITPEQAHRPFAQFIGYKRGDVWWIPTRTTLELMAISAGFIGIEWISDFILLPRNSTLGHYHGVLHAYKTTQNWTPNTQHRDQVIAKLDQPLPDAQDLTFRALAGEIKRYARQRLARFWR
jgi:tRNA (mo5U34)-methyltransferase